MADFRNLKPGQMAKALNSFEEYGEVTDKGRTKSNLDALGSRVQGESAQTIHGYKYAAWLFDQVSKSRPRGESGRTYEEIKAAAARRAAEASAKGRDIGPIPPVVDQQRRDRCRTDLGLFLKTYFPGMFPKEWSKTFHLDTIRAIEESVIHGGQFALALPRGSGKTTICKYAAIWAVLFNFRHFVVVIGNDQGASMDIFNSIKMAFETNELLAQDFPEVCYPVAALEGIANRCAGQLCQGMNTHIRWTDTLVFPTVPGSEIAGNAITTTSITGRIRGISLATADGRSIRPDFVIIDDPQTFESARSLSQVSQRLSIIQGDICGLSGPGTKITAVMPCTVIRPNDLADQLLDRREHPEWHGRRYGLLDGFPEHLPLWQRYWEIRSREMRNDDRLHEESNRFYALNRIQMDEGAEATWQENFDADEVSAVQHAMDIYFQNKSAFYAEYQNDPQAADLGGEEQLTEEDVLSCMDGLPRGFVPSDTARLTMAVDVQANVLYWLVLATSQDFTARVVDYGVYPPQFQQVFDTRTASPTYGDVFPGSPESSLRSALEGCVLPLLDKVYLTDAGVEMKVSRCCIDAGWQTQTVYDFCKDSRDPALMPSRGLGIGATGRPISEGHRRPGEILSKYEWRISQAKGQTRLRVMYYDSNWWKSFVRSRFRTSRAEHGHITVCGESQQGRERLFASHITAEFSREEISGYRRCDVWKLIPGRENHWLDCLSVSCVAASEQGAALLLNPPTASGKEAKPYVPQRPVLPHPPKSYAAARKSYGIVKRY